MTPWQVWRDVAIVSFAISMGVYEIMWGGGRPTVLAFLGGLLGLPIAFGLDRDRRRRRDDEDGT